MNTIEAERLDRQASRIKQLTDELESMSETIVGAEADTNTAPNIGETQTRLQDELEQIISDAHHMLEHSGGLQNERKYDHPRDSFSIVRDSNSDYVVTYVGTFDLDASNTTLTIDKTEYNDQFSGTITTNDKLVVSGDDVTESVKIEWNTDLSHRDKWVFPNGSRIVISDMSNLPETTYHETETFSEILLLDSV
jgi:hypothetical protein